jgi:tRNA(Ile)-lysidine synthase
MRLLRGSGLRGLRGFLPKSKYHGLTIIRPLIELNKEDILKWLEAKKINFCLDKSNFEEKFLRNRIRLKLIPLLKEFNPAIVDNLSSLSQILCLDYDFMYTYSQKIYEELKISETRCLIRLGLEKLKSLHPAILNSIIRIAIENLKGNTRRIELRHIEEVRDLILKRPLGSIVHLPDLAVKKEEKALIIQSLIL